MSSQVSECAVSECVGEQGEDEGAFWVGMG